MPLEVPDSPKIYTTIYDSFRGVDYTHDASNVWKRRSPSGKNMLPNMDGRPNKRTGWVIDLTADDFRDAAGVGSSVEVIPDKVCYFEIGGYDYLMIFNNLGVFAYYQNPVGGGNAQAFEKFLIYLNKYYDLNGVQQNFPPSGYGGIDSKKAFFFEGQGIAGFYIFVGYKLFRYDGAVLLEVKPHIPVVLIGCDPDGAGTLLEPVNIISKERIIQYYCDGTSTVFTLPDGVTSNSVTVEVRNESGGWSVMASGYTVSTANGTITFSTAPQVVFEGQDNLRVTYTPKPYVISERDITRGEKAIFVTEKTTQERYRLNSKTSSTTTNWITRSSSFSPSGATFNTTDVKINQSTKQKVLTVQCRNSANNAWITMDSALYFRREGAYTNDTTVTPLSPIVSSSSIHAESSTTTTDTKSWERRPDSDRSGRYKDYQYKQTRIVTRKKKYLVRVVYTAYVYGDNPTLSAFCRCTKSLVFGSGIINQAFITACPAEEYSARVWYSNATDPTYFPDTNYIEVGASDKPIMGLMKVGEYLGVVKKGTNVGTSIYLAYPTSFDNDTTYAVKQSVNGIGAVSSGAFNSLNEEPLFLSPEGIMAIETGEDTDRQLRNRSFYVNKPLKSEDGLQKAISFVYNGMYWLCVNDRCYVLDGSQKNSWENTKTNLQYEAYYLENVPAQCFAKFDGGLWFTDHKGNLCRFMKEDEPYPYHDSYSVEDPVWTASSAPNNYVYAKSALVGENEEFKVSDTIKYGDNWYTIKVVGETTVEVGDGVPIHAVWSTIADDDGSAHYFKNFRKKGCMVSLVPTSDSGVDVYVKADEGMPIYIGATDAKDNALPYDYFVKKKVKKYKRLQVICENNYLDDGFGVDQIIKSYTLGNYAKEKR